jgi:RNA polymerase sigma-70 factor (ECF subfamily)
MRVENLSANAAGEIHISPDDFASLLKRAAENDSAAQAQLCQHYEAKVRIVARVLLGPALRSHFDSIDLVQSVHRSLLLGLRDEKFDISSPEKLIALASTIVRRKVARKWRRERRQVSLGTNSEMSEGLAQTLSSLSSPDTDPAKVAEYNDLLAKFCEKLNDVERRMLEMRLQGHTSAEVAQALGLHAVALRVRWTRLRQRLNEAGITADWL